MCLCLSSYLILILFFFSGILTVIVDQPSYSVNYGQTIQLVCTVSGNPSAQNIYWQKTKNGVQTKINSNSIKYQGSTTSTPSLTILNADSNDDASYTCFATNTIGTGQSQQTQLSVVGSKFTSLKYNMFF